MACSRNCKRYKYYILRACIRKCHNDGPTGRPVVPRFTRNKAVSPTVSGKGPAGVRAELLLNIQLTKCILANLEAKPIRLLLKASVDPGRRVSATPLMRKRYICS